jgi:hypothetical protein
MPQTRQIFTVAIDRSTGVPTLFAVDATFTAKQVRLAKSLRAFGFATVIPIDRVHTTPEAAIASWSAACAENVKRAEQDLAQAKLVASLAVRGVNNR